MVQGTKDNGKKICSMVMAKRVGQMALFMKVSIQPEKSMEEDFIAGTMALDTMENGKRTKLKVLEHIHGGTGVSTEANGQTTTWMELAYTLGKTAENMKENI